MGVNGIKSYFVHAALPTEKTNLNVRKNLGLPFKDFLLQTPCTLTLVHRFSVNQVTSDEFNMWLIIFWSFRIELQETETAVYSYFTCKFFFTRKQVKYLCNSFETFYFIWALIGNSPILIFLAKGMKKHRYQHQSDAMFVKY